MSLHWPPMLLVLPAAILLWEDFRVREVHLGWLVALGIVAVGIGWHTAGLQVLPHVAFNMGLLLLLGCAMLAWQAVRRRPVRAFLVECFGAGDVVMMAATTPLFGPVGYVRFLLAACLVALAWWVVKRAATIPLAGFMALVLIIYAVCKTAGLWS